MKRYPQNHYCDWSRLLKNKIIWSFIRRSCRCFSIIYRSLIIVLPLFKKYGWTATSPSDFFLKYTKNNHLQLFGNTKFLSGRDNALRRYSAAVVMKRRNILFHLFLYPIPPLDLAFSNKKKNLAWKKLSSTEVIISETDIFLV